jgi:hypothetical protein
MIKGVVRRVRKSASIRKLLGLGAAEPRGREFLVRLLPRKSVGVEIGVHVGDFSDYILRVLRPRELHLIDPWKYEASDTYRQAVYGGKASGGQSELDGRFEAVCRRFQTEVETRRVQIHRGYSTDVLAEFADDYFDWVYIDGNHQYEFARRDLELSFQKTKPGGYITGDDYSEGGWWAGGVKKAVDEFIAQRPVALITIQQRQFILKK